MSKIIDSIKFVVDNSNHIKINELKVNEFCNSFNHEHIKHWIDEAPYKVANLNDKEKLHFLLVFNAISYSYWGEPKWTIKYKRERYDGSWAMIASIGKAIENGMPILDPRFLSNMSKKDFVKLTEGNIEIPLLEDRLNMIREVGKVLIEKYDCDFTNLVNSSNGDAIKLLELLIENFELFKDTSKYNKKHVYFYKRAQLLIADIFQAFQGNGVGKLKNISKITACADYKIPQMLRKFGILEYDEELSKKIDNNVRIPKGSKEEVEIRANTIWAVELIKDNLKDKIKNIDSIHVNDHLWLLSQTKSPDNNPYHLTRTTAY